MANLAKEFMNAVLPTRAKAAISTLRKRRKKLRKLRAKQQATNWAKEQAIDISQITLRADESLWLESEDYARELNTGATDTLSRSSVEQGGPGAYALLHFLVLRRKPDLVVETGVASGWSSAAILSALEKNGSGRLFSSDLPYPDRDGSAEAIGLVVEDNLRDRWTLCTEGDDVCLPKLLSEKPSIDIFHYDSKKTYQGREFGWRCVEGLLSEDAIVIFDDIQDNLHFHDLVLRRGGEFYVFEFSGKYVGVFSKRARISF